MRRTEGVYEDNSRQITELYCPFFKTAFRNKKIKRLKIAFGARHAPRRSVRKK